MTEFREGLKNSIPIALGYFSVSAAYGMSAVNAGLAPAMAALISLTSLTSAGQFAGTEIMARREGWITLGIAMIVINARYFLMSLSLSQKLEADLPWWKRAMMAYGITDEIFAAASAKKTVYFSYMMGLILPSVFGWTAGTLTGALAASWMPVEAAQCLSVAMYGMFVAILVPKARKVRSILECIILASLFSCLFSFFSLGSWRVIAASVLAAGIMAWRHPEMEHDME